MDHSYSIQEVSELFLVSTHTIRHYEKLKLIHPKRKRNNYRVFGSEEVSKLSIIRYLVSLNISLEVIGLYFENQTITEMIEMLTQSQKILYRKSNEISRKLRALNNYLDFIKRCSESDSELNTVIVKQKNDRYFYRNDEAYSCHSDFIVNMQLLYHKIIEDVDAQYEIYTGGIIEYDNKEVRYVGQFIISSSNMTTKNVMDEGLYASYLFKSNTVELENILEKMSSEIERMGYLIQLPFYQFNLISYYETGHTDDYLTEIQIKLKKA